MSNTVTTEKLEVAYRYMYDDELVGFDDTQAADDFTANFCPDNVNWKDRDSAVSAFRSLVSELYESRSDMVTLFADAGISPCDLAELDML